jgi:hypothetical protein
MPSEWQSQCMKFVSAYASPRVVERVDATTAAMSPLAMTNLLGQTNRAGD